MPNTELGMGRIIFIKLALKILKLDVRILKLSLFHSFIVHEKKRILNASVLQEYVVIFLVFRVLYKWDSEGINSAINIRWNPIIFNIIEATQSPSSGLQSFET